MLIGDVLVWWYGTGWRWAATRLFVEHTKRLAAFFSITDLMKTLFAPFRQDAVQLQGAPLNIRFRAFGENIISRLFGMMIRLTLVVAGVLAILVNGLLATVLWLLWPLLPIMPVIVVGLLFVGGG